MAVCVHETRTLDNPQGDFAVSRSRINNGGYILHSCLVRIAPKQTSRDFCAGKKG